MRDPATRSGTNWSALPVDQMWSMIERHDGTTFYPVIDGWRRSYELVLRHLSSVQRYRDSLAAAWPPDRSPAARAYLDRLDVLIRSLKETYEAAILNHRAFSMATSALDSTRRTMQEIEREYAANKAMLTAYRDEIRLYHLVGGKAKGVPPNPPVPEARQVELEQRARKAMSDLSGELAEAQVSFTKPAPYTSSSIASIREEHVNLASASGFLASERALPGPPGTGKSTTSSTASPPTLPSDGPEGFPTTTGHVPRGAVPNSRRQAPAPAPAPSPSTSEGEARRIRPLLGVIGPTPPETRPFSNTIAASRHSSHTTKSQPNALGSVIGGVPGPPSSRSSQPVQRVNPVGGVIGSQYPAAISPSAAISAASRKSFRTTRADEVWKVAQGIDPVWRPSQEKPIDPGPVIGHLRQ